MRAAVESHVPDDEAVEVPLMEDQRHETETGRRIPRIGAAIMTTLVLVSAMAMLRGRAGGNMVGTSTHGFEGKDDDGVMKGLFGGKSDRLLLSENSTEKPKEKPSEEPKEKPKEKQEPKEESKKKSKEHSKEDSKEESKKDSKEESKEEPKEESKEESPNLSSALFYRLLAQSVLMLACGYAGESGIVSVLCGFIPGCLCWLALCYEMFAGECSQISAGSGNKACQSAFNTLRLIISVGWSIYPLGYYLTLLGPTATYHEQSVINITYNIADLVNKLAFGLAIWGAAITDK